VSTFIGKGQSYEASDGNHDDLVMNLVLFGFFVTSEQFLNLTDINVKDMMFSERIRAIEDDVVPFGFIDTGADAIAAYEATQEDQDRYAWQVVHDPEF
jgi:hypothetical protein